MSPISDALDTLTAKVEALTTVQDSAITLLQGLAQQIRDNSTAPAKLLELATKIDAQAAEMSAAIEAHTV